MCATDIASARCTHRLHTPRHFRHQVNHGSSDNPPRDRALATTELARLGHETVSSVVNFDEWGRLLYELAYLRNAGQLRWGWPHISLSTHESFESLQIGQRGATRISSIGRARSPVRMSQWTVQTVDISTERTLISCKIVGWQMNF